MDLIDELRIALRGQIEDGTIARIRQAGYVSRDGGPPLQVFVISVNAPDPMRHLQPIVQAIYAAGLMNALGALTTSKI
jgi:hypothetical protein